MKKNIKDYTTIQIRKTTRDMLLEYAIKHASKTGAFMTHDQAVIHAITGKLDRTAKIVAHR